MKSFFNRLVLAFTAMFAGISLFAQVTTSGIAGTVIDEKGETIPGAVIVAIHNPSGTVYAVSTNAEGHYSLDGMRTGGPYSVEITSLGHKKVIYNDVTLRLGESFTLNVFMVESSIELEEAIVLASPSSKFSGEESGATTVITSHEIESMPNASRSVADITRLSPYGGNGNRFSGSDGRRSNFNVDGANFNNNFGLKDVLPGGGSPISIDALDEVQVVVAPYDVRQTNFIGGGVNAITKSGTNTFKGSAYVYHRNENLHGNRIANVDLPNREIDRLTTYGMTLGGPIVKDKLFFFVNAEYDDSPTVTYRWSPSANGVANEEKKVSAVSKEDLDNIVKHLDKEYDFNPGSYSNFSAHNTNFKVLGRLDWNITDKHHLAARFNYTRNVEAQPVSVASSPNPRFTMTRLNTTGPNSQPFSDSGYEQNNMVATASLDLNSRFSDNIFNQFLATYSIIKEWREPSSERIFPFVDIMTAGDASVPYTCFGSELYSYNNTVQNNVLTAKDELSIFISRHKITAGLSYEFQYAKNSYMQFGTGYYRYASVDDFISGAAPTVLALTYGYDGNQKPFASVTYHNAGIYAQDEWRINDKLKFTYGLRIDTIIFDNSALKTNENLKNLDFGGRKMDTGVWPKTRPQLSPRAGLVWDVFGDSSLKIRGGAGLFAGRLPLVYFVNMPGNSGMLQNSIAITDAAILQNFAGKIITSSSEILDKLNGLDANAYPKSIVGGGPVPTKNSSLCGVNPDFKMPQVFKASFAVDYNIPVSFPFSVSGEYVFNKTINGIRISNWNINMDKVERMEGPDNRYFYTADSKYGKTDLYVLENTQKGYGMMASISTKLTPIKNLDITASYTWTMSKEVTGMLGSNAKSVYTGSIVSINGPEAEELHNSMYVIPHRVTASLSYTEKNNHFSLFYTGYVPAPATYPGASTYIYKGDVNGDGVGFDLLYIPKDKDELMFVSQQDRDTFWEYVESNEYLSSHKGQYAEAFTATSPMVHRLDFSYAYDFKFKIGKSTNRIRLSADFCNILNMVNSNWGVEKILSQYNSTGQLLELDHMEGKTPVYKTGKLYDTSSKKIFDYNHDYSQCWYIQLGIKYLFN